MDAIRSLLAENDYILTEGAMGTMLFAAGLTQGYSPELWKWSSPKGGSNSQVSGCGRSAHNSFGGNASA
jgi:hypothetical protein